MTITWDSSAVRGATGRSVRRLVPGVGLALVAGLAGGRAEAQGLKSMQATARVLAVDTTQFAVLEQLRLHQAPTLTPGAVVQVREEELPADERNGAGRRERRITMAYLRN